MTAVQGYRFGMSGEKGIILCARQFMNSLDDSSLEEIKRAIEEEPFLAEYYDVGDKYIKSRDGRISYAFAGLDRNIASVKSKGRILLCWVDEAEPVTEDAWRILEPTLREEGTDWNAELWVSWNPLRPNAPVEKRFANSKDPLIRCVTINWVDNPRFPDKLERQRNRDLEERLEQYDHIWEGGFLVVKEGAYYAKALAETKAKGRIKPLSIDPLMAIRSYHDIGGAGAKADAYSIWICQFIDSRIHVLDHYTSQGQSLAFHVKWMRDHGYENAEVILPHDGVNTNNVSGKQYKDHWEDAGFSVKVVPNQGAGAAMMRVEAARRLFPRIYFDVDLTLVGRTSLGWYHPKIVEREGSKVDLGPNHDWASHDADSFGLMCVDYQEPKVMAAVIPVSSFGAV